jgi:hypothetical protein
MSDILLYHLPFNVFVQYEIGAVNTVSKSGILICHPPGFKISSSLFVMAVCFHFLSIVNNHNSHSVIMNSMVSPSQEKVESNNFRKL